MNDGTIELTKLDNPTNPSPELIITYGSAIEVGELSTTDLLKIPLGAHVAVETIAIV